MALAHIIIYAFIGLGFIGFGIVTAHLYEAAGPTGLFAGLLLMFFVGRELSRSFKQLRESREKKKREARKMARIVMGWRKEDPEGGAEDEKDEYIQSYYVQREIRKLEKEELERKNHRIQESLDAEFATARDLISSEDP